MSLIIETDLGADPDDYFALCYLLSSGISINSIMITPGYPDQVAIARFLIEEIGREIIVGSSTTKKKNSLSGFYRKLRERYGIRDGADPDGQGACLLKESMSTTEEYSLLVIGPPKNVGRFLQVQRTHAITEATIQGGFISYDEHGLSTKKAKNLSTVEHAQSYNLNGYMPGSRALLRSNMRRRFVSKNVNHCIYYDINRMNKINEVPAKNRAGQLFREAGEIYFQNSGRPKKFHDPNAAVCHLHPEIATWVRARMLTVDDVNPVEWYAVLDPEGDEIIADIKMELLWTYLAEGKQ